MPRRRPRLAAAPGPAQGPRGGGASSAEGIVLAADTLVVVEGASLGKPSDRTRTRAPCCARLSGRAHRVITGVAVVEARDEPASDRPPW